MSDESRKYNWTCMGKDDSGYGPWRYQVFSSEEELRKKLRLSANVETDPTARVTSLTFQPDELYRSQDRRVVQSWNLRNGRWTFVGHSGHETVDYAATELPLRIRSKLEGLLQEAESASICFSPEIVSSLLADTITKFDESLLNDLLSLFPGGLDAVLTLSGHQIWEILKEADSQNLKKMLRCKQGSTALISIVDPSGENLWVANLGDCEAVLGTNLPDGTWKATPLTTNHNGGNKAEVQRIRDEHPGENECILKDRVLGGIAVTRALGDYTYKLPAAFATLVFLKPQAFVGMRLEELLSRNLTHPYLSNRPDVLHHRLTGKMDEKMDAAAPNTFLIMCSDGLTGVYPKQNNDITHWVQTVGSAMERGVAPALELLWQALGGDTDTVAQYLTLESDNVWMDDTTIAVLTL